MNIEDLRYKDLVDDLLLINVNKLTDEELEELAENMETLAKKLANEVIKRYVANGGKIF